MSIADGSKSNYTQRLFLAWKMATFAGENIYFSKNASIELQQEKVVADNNDSRFIIKSAVTSFLKYDSELEQFTKLVLTSHEIKI